MKLLYIHVLVILVLLSTTNLLNGVAQQKESLARKGILVADISNIKLPKRKVRDLLSQERMLEKTLKVNGMLASGRSSRRIADPNASLVWNRFARELVIKNNVPPPLASRVYALLSVGQNDALSVAYYNKNLHKEFSPRIRVKFKRERYSYPSEDATVAKVSADILKKLFSSNVSDIDSLFNSEILRIKTSGEAFKEDISGGINIGRIVSKKVAKYADSDNSNDATPYMPPAVAVPWNSLVGKPPLLPNWGKTKPWLMTTGSQFRSPPPPAVNSPEFNLYLGELREIERLNNPEQLKIAQFWADGVGTYTPPGHWNAIVDNMIVKNNRRGIVNYLNELSVSRILAAMNMSIMDAGIGCWETKYFYFYPRPSNIDSTLSLPVGLPNFPAYTSGHSTFSAAAAKLLSCVFPEQEDSLMSQAEEASKSRIYGRIHWGFDSEEGLKMGIKIGELGCEWYKLSQIDH